MEICFPKAAGVNRHTCAGSRGGTLPPTPEKSYAKSHLGTRAQAGRVLIKAKSKDPR